MIDRFGGWEPHPATGQPLGALDGVPMSIKDVLLTRGWPTLRGRDEVMRSWAMIMANTSYIQFVLTDVELALAGDVAVVTCVENIITAADDDAGSESTAFAGAGTV